MSSFKQKTEKHYEAVGVFSEETLPPPCFLLILLCFSQKKMFSAVDTCHISIISYISIIHIISVSYHYLHYFEDNVKDLPTENLDGQVNPCLETY